MTRIARTRVLALLLCQLVSIPTASLAQTPGGAPSTAAPSAPAPTTAPTTEITPSSPTATAIPTDVTRAESLFGEGKKLLAAKDFERACEAFAESQRLDPATGTLLALALCHEAQGKLATATREYREVAQRAETEGRSDRASAAKNKASALEPTLSRLTVQRDAAQADLRLRVDGAVLTPEQVGAALPVDGGEHTLDALRGEVVVWSTRVTLAQSKDEQRVVVPPLGEPKPEPAASPKPAEPARPRPDELERAAHAERGLTPGQWAGLATLGAAALGLGLGAGFALSAISSNEDSKVGCDGELCTAKARQQRLDARFAGDVATVAILSGAALATVGAAIFFAHPRRTASEDRASIVRVDGWADRHGAGARVGGHF